MNDLKYEIEKVGDEEADFVVSTTGVYISLTISKKQAIGLAGDLLEFAEEDPPKRNEVWGDKMTPRTQQAMAIAKTIATSIGDSYISTTHIELALMQMRVLNDRNIELNIIEK